jgi:hypothetical protein
MLRQVSEGDTGYTTLIFSSVGVFAMAGQNPRKAVAQFNAIAKESQLSGDSITVMLHSDSSTMSANKTEKWTFTRKDSLSDYVLGMLHTFDVLARDYH